MEAADEALSQGSIGGARSHLYAGLQGSRLMFPLQHMTLLSIPEENMELPRLRLHW